MIVGTPELFGVPLSPTSVRKGQPRFEYGEMVKVPLLNILPVLAIEWYQRRTVDRPHVCTQYPSCSEYARLAYLRYNVIAASFMTIERLKVCSDFFSEWPQHNKP